jgi:hypothetical protein
LGHGPRTTSIVTTRSLVETTLTVVKLIGYNMELPEKYSDRTLGHVYD